MYGLFRDLPVSDSSRSTSPSPGASRASERDAVGAVPLSPGARGSERDAMGAVALSPGARGSERDAVGAVPLSPRAQVALSHIGMSLDEGRQSQRPYRYGMVLLCAGALINWLGLAEDYAEPVRYVGVACIVAGALLICAAMCCWLQSPARQPQHDRASPDTHQIDDPIHVISMPDDESMQQKPPDYDTVAGAPPTYDDAIKLNPARLLPATATSSAREPAPPPPIPGQLDDAASAIPRHPVIAPVHRSQVPKTPPPPYNPTHAIR